VIEYIVRVLHHGAPRAGFVARIDDDIEAACSVARAYERSARDAGLDWAYLVEGRDDGCRSSVGWTSFPSGRQGRLRCESDDVDGHPGPCWVTIPKDAGEDAGKRLVIPRGFTS
jgi:hypothetical protein